MSITTVDLIKKKRDKLSLTKNEIEAFINNYSKGYIPDYQASALLMAIFINGMNSEEIANLTQSMLNSGIIFNFSHLQGSKIDKHSTGGVGDKTSLILAPLVASCGVYVPMIAGRGLGHTGGTLDKLESLTHFNTQLTKQQFESQVAQLGFSIMGQTPEICPADKKLYALRDVTATIESLPLICGSIMSKKMAEGIDGLVLDVKWGNGAFMKTIEQANELALLLKATGEKNNISVHALITNMNQPLGTMIGNSLEVYECLYLMGESIPFEINEKLIEDTKKLTLTLASHMVYLGKKANSLESAYTMVEENLSNGKTLRLFKDMIERQQGRLELPKNYNPISLLSPTSGYINSIETEKLGHCAIEVKAGRKIKSDVLDYASGFQLLKKQGDKVLKDEPLLNIYCSAEFLTDELKNQLSQCFQISSSHQTAPNLIAKVIL